MHFYDSLMMSTYSLRPNTYNLRLIVTVFFMLLTSLNVCSQEVSDFTFSHIEKSDGLRSQRIYTIQQTADGALWWSTKNGVQRYNGVSTRHYNLDPSSDDKRVTSSILASRYIKLSTHYNDISQLPTSEELIAFDNKGRIYAYSPIFDDFIEKADIAKLIGSEIELNDVLSSKTGMWLATKAGVFFLHEDKLIPVKKGVYANFIIRSNASLLFCTRSGVLQYLNNPNQTPSGHNLQLPTIVPFDVESGYYDPLFNKVWLGGYSSGIHVLSFNESGQHVSHQELVETEGGTVQNPVRSICPYNDHTMLVGIDGLGVYKADRHPSSSGKYVGSLLFNANQGPHGVLHGNGIYAVVHDMWDNIVIGSYSGGIDIARPVGTTLAIFQHLPPSTGQSILNDRVNCVLELADGTLAMGTDNGVSMINPHSRQWTHACHGAVVLSLCATPTGKLLAATYGKGVFEVGRDGSSHQLYSKAGGTLKDDHVYKLLRDSNGNLWIGCLDGDLVQITDNGPKYYPIQYIKDLLQLPDGRIVVGSAQGISILNPSTGAIKPFMNNKGGQQMNSHIHALYLNNKNELWIGTDGGGIYICDLKGKELRHLTTAEGLTSDYVGSFCKDALGRILVGTEDGLSFIDPKHPDRAIGVNYCLGVDREYSSRAAIALSDGHILLGSTTGALVIDPYHVQELNYTAKLNILNITCDEGDSDSFREKLHRMLQDGRVVLSYSQRTFELYYESINLRNQSDIVYQYKVGDGEWSTPSDEQYIRFTNLEPGGHKLLLRSLSRSCGTVLDEVELTITISSPWWDSWWMWMVYILLLFAVLYGLWRIYELHEKYMRLVLLRSEVNTTPMNPVETSAEDVPEEEDNEFIDKATRLVVENISDTEFTIDRLCREMAMSRTLFYIKLKSYTGKSPQDFIRVIRLERAAALLRSGRSVADVAAMAGFDNPKYFSTVFKKYFKVSPSKYAEKV